MNKYQEALNGLVNVKENFVYHEGKMIQIKNIKNAKLLQELVDKSTPKKPIELDMGRYQYNEWKKIMVDCCDFCKKPLVNLVKKENYCVNCGQAIDWSKDD